MTLHQSPQKTSELYVQVSQDVCVLVTTVTYAHMIRSPSLRLLDCDAL